MPTLSKDDLDRCGSLSWFASNVLNIDLSPAQLYMLSPENEKILKGQVIIRNRKPSSMVRKWFSKQQLKINEGEERCPICNGEKGRLLRCGINKFEWVACSRCNRTGKIDWIRKAMI